MKLTKEEMNDLLITAIEGGSNYWYDLPDLSMIKKSDNNFPVSEDIFSNIYLDKSLQIPVGDVEGEDDEILGYISYDNLKRADDLLKTENYKWVVNDVKAESWDASTADVWFQLVVLGEIVYG